jgi:hypothetical protein
MLIQNEESTPGNAGQVIFPSRNTRKGTTNLSPQQIFDKLQLERSQIVSRKFQAPETFNIEADGRVRAAGDAPTILQRVELLSRTVHQTNTLHDNPQEKTWEHLNEQRFMLLSGTPLYRSQAESAIDYIHAWAILGTAACALGFDATNNKGKDAHDTFVPSELKKLDPPLTVWAGPFFEQAHLATLRALDSHTCFTATLPGPNFFMQKNLALAPEEKFLKHQDNPFETKAILLPAGIHAHGKTNKSLLVHLDFDMWMPIEIALAGIGKAIPFYCRNEDSIDVGLAAWMRAASKLHHEHSDISWWKRVNQDPLVSKSIDHDKTLQKLLHNRFPIFDSNKFATNTEQHTDHEPEEPLDRQRSAVEKTEIRILCNGLDDKRPSPVKHDIVLGNRSGFRQCYGLADTQREKSTPGPTNIVSIKTAPNHITEATLLFYNMPATQAVWDKLFGNIAPWIRPTAVLRLPSWLTLPESHYLLAVALQINHQTPRPVQHLQKILNGHFTHSETLTDQDTFHTAFSPIVPDLRQLHCGLNNEDPFSLVSINGFSAGSLIGMSIFRLLAECGTTIRTIPNDTTLGAIAMSPLLFYNFSNMAALHPPQWNLRRDRASGAKENCSGKE